MITAGSFPSWEARDPNSTSEQELATTPRMPASRWLLPSSHTLDYLYPIEGHPPSFPLRARCDLGVWAHGRLEKVPGRSCAITTNIQILCNPKLPVVLCTARPQGALRSLRMPGICACIDPPGTPGSEHIWRAWAPAWVPVPAPFLPSCETWGNYPQLAAEWQCQHHLYKEQHHTQLCRAVCRGTSFSEDPACFLNVFPTGAAFHHQVQGDLSQ